MMRRMMLRSTTPAINLYQNSVLNLDYQETIAQRYKDSIGQAIVTQSNDTVFNLVTGKFGLALEFNSSSFTSGRLDVAAADSTYFPNGNRDFTFRTWFKKTTGSGGYIFGLPNNVNNNSFSLLMLNNGSFEVRPGFANRFSFVETGFNDNNWHRLVLVVPQNGLTTDMKLYVDGNELTKVSDPQFSYVFATTGLLRLYNSVFNVPFYGVLDSTTVDLDKAFSFDEVVLDWNNGNGVLYDENLHQGTYDIWLVMGNSQLSGYAPFVSNDNLPELQNGIVNGVDAYNNSWIIKDFDLRKPGLYGDGSEYQTANPTQVFKESFSPDNVALFLLSQENTYNRPLSCKVSVAGSSLINDWNSSNLSGYLYDLESKLNNIKNLLDSKGQLYNIKGVIIWLPENDALISGAAAVFESNMLALINSVRNYTGIPNLPFILNSCPTASVTYFSSVINQAQVNIANNDANVYLNDNSSATILDSVHLDAISSKEAGIRIKNIIVNNNL